MGENQKIRKIFGEETCTRSNFESENVEMSRSRQKAVMVLKLMHITNIVETWFASIKAKKWFKARSSEVGGEIH